MQPGIIISTILKHDSKVTSYKIALLRAINDVVLAFPDLRNYHRDVAIPLRVLAEFWVAYYWPFVAPDRPILQGQRSLQGDKLRNDMAFRPQLTAVRQAWETFNGSVSQPADGFFLINELRVPRKHDSYSFLSEAYKAAIKEIAKTLEMPIQYAGPGHWSVFPKPIPFDQLAESAIAIPGTQPKDKCLLIRSDLWETFREMSLWIEALCIHEWCLFTETIQQEQQGYGDRGSIYRLLTERPDNRRPLTWERNHVDILLMEGQSFICPWSHKQIECGTPYHLDHLLPVSIYPINELWNLVPADPQFNSHKKRNLLPSDEQLQRARPYLEMTYIRYEASKALSRALREDVALRFSTVPAGASHFPQAVSAAVVSLLLNFASSRNLVRFS